MVGYSGKPLVEKLGMKERMSIVALNQPNNYIALLQSSRTFQIDSVLQKETYDLIHIFVTTQSELTETFPKLINRLSEKGMIWVSWSKKTAAQNLKYATDLDENIIRDSGLAQGMVDIKVCAVDETWSGLKFVRRKAKERD